MNTNYDTSESPDSKPARKGGFISKFYGSDDSPPEIFNSRLYLAVFLFGILGAGRGYDEGNVAGSVAQKSFIEFAGLDDESKSESYLANLKSNIKSMVLLGSIGGSLIAIYFVDKFGRLRTLQGLCILWAIGSAIQVSSYSLGQLYAGRLIEGFAIGQTVVVGPCYLSEVAPKNIRGLCNCVFAGAVYLGSALANFANYGTALHVSNKSRSQWVIPTSLKIILAGGLLTGTFFVKESPRWLVKEDKIEEAVDSLAHIRNLPKEHPYVQSEISDIQEQLLVERSELSTVSGLDIVRELFLVKSNTYRLFLGIAAQILGQWSFAGSITMYMPELAALVGIKGTDKIMFSGVLAVVKLTAAYISAFFLIDALGRKRCLYTGIAVQLVSTLYFATFLAVVPDVEDDDYVMSSSQEKYGVSALTALFMSGVGWALGWNSIQYLINSEMFPLRVRNLGTAIIMAFHFVNQYANSKALPSLMLAMTPYGTFYFASAVLLVGLFWAWFFLPEIAGRSLESMEELFNLPWYLIGRKGAQLCPDQTGLAYLVETQHKAEDIQVENASTMGSHADLKDEKHDDVVHVHSRA